MKFSLKLLLAITLLAVLTVNGFNNRHQSHLIATECKAIEKAILIEKLTTNFYEEKKLVYSRAQSAFQRRKERLSEAPEFFEPVMRVHGKPDIQDSDKIHIWCLPGDASAYSDGVVRERFRIWVPDSTPMELCLGYYETSSKDERQNLRDSFYFDTKEKLVHKLEPGECFVELAMRRDYRDKSDIVELSVDGVDTRSVKRKQVLSSHELSMMRFKRTVQFDSAYSELAKRMGDDGSGSYKSISDSSEDVFPPERLELVTMGFWPTEDEPESVALVIRPVEREAADEQ